LALRRTIGKGMDKSAYKAIKELLGAMVKLTLQLTGINTGHN